MNAVKWLLVFLLAASPALYYGTKNSADVGVVLLCCSTYLLVTLAFMLIFGRLLKRATDQLVDVDVSVESSDGSDSDYIQSLRHSD